MAAIEMSKEEMLESVKEVVERLRAKEVPLDDKVLLIAPEAWELLGKPKELFGIRVIPSNRG